MYIKSIYKIYAKSTTNLWDGRAGGFLAAVSGQESELAMSALAAAQSGQGRGALEVRGKNLRILDYDVSYIWMSYIRYIRYYITHYLNLDNMDYGSYICSNNYIRFFGCFFKDSDVFFLRIHLDLI